jgi:uncharacterized protein involved in exopolysaccharide biosynthesis
LVNPNEVASQLAEENQLLEELHDRIVELNEEVTEKHDNLKEDLKLVKIALGMKPTKK